MALTGVMWVNTPMFGRPLARDLDIGVRNRLHRVKIGLCKCLNVFELLIHIILLNHREKSDGRSRFSIHTVVRMNTFEVARDTIIYGAARAC